MYNDYIWNTKSEWLAFTACLCIYFSSSYTISKIQGARVCIENSQHVYARTWSIMQLLHEVISEVIIDQLIRDMIFREHVPVNV